MGTTYLTESQRREFFRLATLGMVLMLLAANGGRYLSISPSVFLVSFSALALSWLAVTRRDSGQAHIRLDRPAD